MASARSIFTLVALPVLALGLLAGCSADPIGDAVDQVSGGTIDVGGASLPDDFPADVPLAAGDVIYGARVGTGTGKVWNITISSTTPFTQEDVAAQLTAAGFAAASEIPGLPDLGPTGGYTNGTWGVGVVVTADGDGYVANYTVTAVPQ